MNKYEWLWKTMKEHKQKLVDKFESGGKQGTTGHLQHKSALDVMKFLELREEARHKHADVSIDDLRRMSEL